ncbi:MAG: translesion DNA synthesis-associated protein ImuA [Candidatus Tectomicrobia bacterium]|nr:translesion DNA synthesis-associated protein ImuA [Candidatus Tectomicrobia bacterium]
MPPLEELIAQNRWLWRGYAPPVQSGSGLSTGFPELNDVLPQAGWPTGALVDMTVTDWGLGEVRLLLPAMAQVMAQQRQVVWIAPPYLPHAAALSQHGVRLELLTIVTPGDSRAIVWSIEKFLRASACGLAIAWPGGIAPSALRRLQLAAEEYDTPAFLLRRAARPPNATPAALCLYLQGSADRLHITIVKARGGCRHPRVTLSP